MKKATTESMRYAVKFKTVDEYIKSFPVDTRTLLTQMRNLIKELAPNAKEKISYNMPAYELNGILVYYAAYKKHFGFYPTSNVIETFKNELTSYKFSKGAIQFPLDKPLPKGLITKIVKYRVKENLQKSKQ